MSDKTQKVKRSAGTGEAFGKAFYVECFNRVYQSGSMVSFNCSRRGTKEHKGKWYCWQHYPPTVKAREAKAREKWDAEFDAARQENRRDLEVHEAMKNVGVVEGESSEGVVLAAIDALNSVRIETEFMANKPDEPLIISRNTLRAVQTALARFERNAKEQTDE